LYTCVQGIIFVRIEETAAKHLQADRDRGRK